MWNYIGGWDNASTIALEVERPQRTYPKAMIAAVILVSADVCVAVRGGVFGGSCRRRIFRRRRLGEDGRSSRPERGTARIGWDSVLVLVRNDKRVWDVTRAGHELFEAAAGHGTGRDAPAGVR